MSRSLQVLTLAAVAMLAASVGHAAVIEVDPPLQISATAGQSATMAIPRWKGYMDPDDTSRFWAMHSGWSSTATNIVFTDDFGETWQDTGMQAIEDGYLDYHSSLFGFDGDLYVTAPSGGSIRARHWEWPAQSNADRRALISIPGTTSAHRSNTMVDGNGRWWVFTRLTDSPGENVEYSYSDDKGAHWTYGQAYATNTNEIRIGSMPADDGSPLLVVIYLQSDRGYEYYKWNGTRFVALPDHSIWAEYQGFERRFTHNMVGDNFHLIFREGTRLRHVWKPQNGGVGAWNTSLIPTDESGYIEPVATVRGNELFLFYSLRADDSNEASSRVRCIVWNQDTRSWGEEIDVSNNTRTYNVQPNTCYHVPTTSDYVPVFWTASADGDDVMFSKLIVTPTHVAAPDAPAAGATLLPAYPNPFNPRTVIPFELPRDASVKLAVHDLAGRLITVLTDGSLAAGRHEFTWTGTDRQGQALPSGVYHTRLIADGEVSSRRVTLVR